MEQHKRTITIATLVFFCFAERSRWRILPGVGHLAENKQNKGEVLFFSPHTLAVSPRLPVIFHLQASSLVRAISSRCEVTFDGIRRVAPCTEQNA